MLCCSSCHGSGVTVAGGKCSCTYRYGGVYKSTLFTPTTPVDKERELREAWWAGFIKGVRCSLDLLEEERERGSTFTKPENFSFKDK